jgi:hypothetical protein
MAKKLINKISDKLATVNDSFSVTMYDNGFLFDISGHADGDWRSAKILVPTIDKLLELVKEATEMPRDGEED